MEYRSKPDTLLEYVQKQELLQNRAKLKIFLGAAPGVGKTYTMLEDALDKRRAGVDIVAGVVETHGRPETEALLRGFEIFPRIKKNYHGHELTEFDLDGILKRQPSLVLVDEMAHTNLPGLRHPKRWQDIKELLDRGIDVYTTLNVQHIESLNDIVAQITGVVVRETVPDSMLEMAYAIEVVDLPPDDLLKRLQEGKVYIPSQAGIAIDNFFRPSNLITLRELALRVTAEQVNAQVLLRRRGESIEQIWPTVEKLLVCVGPNPSSAKLVRATFRMAKSLQAEWLAVYVEVPRLRPSDPQRHSAIQHLRLAEELGGEIITLSGRDIAKEIISYARARNVTKIIVGKELRPKWKDWLFSSLADELLRKSGEIELYIINGATDEIKSPKDKLAISSSPWSAYLFSFIIIAVCTAIDFFLYRYLGLSNLVMVYLLGIVIVATQGNMLPSIFATIFSVIAFDFFFVPPRFSFAVADTQYLITLLVMLFVAGIISHLTVLNQQQTEATRKREQRTATLNILSRKLARNRGVDRLLTVAVRYISEVFGSMVFALLPDISGRLIVRAGSQGKPILNSKEQSIAQWVFDLGQSAGLGTQTLSDSDAIYIPLLGSRNAIGALRIVPKESDRLSTSEQINLLESFAHQIALALEVDMLQDQAKKSELQMATDRVRSILLQSVSHDLRTPLISIMSASSSITERVNELDGSTIKKLAKEIYHDSEELNRLINNLLQMTYLEGKAIKLQKEFYSLHDTVNLVLKTLSRQLGKKTVHIQFPSDLPLIPYDRVLIEQVFTHLIDNAIKYTSQDTKIEIAAFVKNEKIIIISVSDNGPGLTSEEVNKIFDKFYRGQTPTSGSGMGLGLAICRSIIHAHGGEIWAENRSQGGASFQFSLPTR